MPTVTLSPRSADSIASLLLNRDTVGAKQILRKIRKGVARGKFNLTLTPSEGEELAQVLADSFGSGKKTTEIKNRNTPSDEWSTQSAYMSSGGR